MIKMYENYITKHDIRFLRFVIKLGIFFVLLKIQSYQKCRIMFYVKNLKYKKVTLEKNITTYCEDCHNYVLTKMDPINNV